MVIAANLGFPRIGAGRELKRAVEGYWSGTISEDALEQVAADLRREHWTLQYRQGINHIPSNDFSFYDSMLDMICTVGAVPKRFEFSGGQVDKQTYFAMARGIHDEDLIVPAMEMSKWFDTNYHYIVPEFSKDTEFKLSSNKIISEFREAKEQGIQTRPVIIGPISFLLLGKMQGRDNALSLLPKLLPVYEKILADLAAAGAGWVQIDEPIMATDLPYGAHAAYISAFDKMANVSGKLRLMLTTYFGGLGENLQTAVDINCAGIHIDLVNAPRQLDEILEIWPGMKALSLGVIDGRNIWRSDLVSVVKIVEKASDAIGNEWVQVAPSCSLLHVPMDMAQETSLNDELIGWISFAKQKLAEVATAAAGVSKGRSAIRSEMEANRLLFNQRSLSQIVHNDNTQQRMAQIVPEMAQRNSDFVNRIGKQEQALGLPLLPVTTVGSFPQTNEVRVKRATFNDGKMGAEEYEGFIKREIEECIKFQAEIGLDVLVHGEFERNDMVEYFAERLKGFATTEHGWVQSYGTRCVKPPILFGDILRSAPLTLFWLEYAQSLTNSPVKAILTGPVTMLNWSFVRNDQPLEQTCRQIAVAMRDEVLALEDAGIKIIQVDEPAFRQGLPLKKAQQQDYLNWAIMCFRLTVGGVADETQIHTHMCYSEFSEIIEEIAAMDADVISIETLSSQMELLNNLADYNYPNQIGTGIYDVRSTHIPTAQEITILLQNALEVLAPSQLWVNPDCGLKTRKWEEIKPALSNMVKAASKLRQNLSSQQIA